MPPLSALSLLALALALAAAVIGRWRHRAVKACLVDGFVAAAAAGIPIIIGVLAHAQGHSADAWRNAGSGAFAAAPFVCAAALRWLRASALPRTLLSACAAWTAAAAWLLLQLKGPWGGWTLPELLIAVPAAAAITGAGGCAGAWTKRRDGVLAKAGHSSASALLLLTISIPLGCSKVALELELSVVDGSTGQPIPARLELLAENGKTVVPDDGAVPIAADCGLSPLQSWIVNWVPAFAPLQVAWGRTPKFRNPYTETDQFYLDGSATLRLPPGRYRVRAYRGPEYRVAVREIELRAGARTKATIPLIRWADLRAEGWYSADDHLHIPRPHPSFDPEIAAWMQAEDLHVANLLQMGLARDVHITHQHRFGEPSAYRRGDTTLLSGQENPRTHILGHSIILGAPKWIDFPDAYVFYPLFWEEAHRLGAVAGFAHFGVAGAEAGLSLYAEPHRLDFVEVQNFGLHFYDRWYEALNLGLRLTPTAGTDHPCVASIPGRDRFYTQVSGEFSIEAWIEAIRQGRTFVTNGPFLDLSIDGEGIGAELTRDGPTTVAIEGRVRFDSERDRVSQLELVEAGEVVLSVEEVERPGEMVLRASREVTQSTWFALRASGWKPGERRPPSLDGVRFAFVTPPSRSSRKLLRNEAFAPKNKDRLTSAAHTAPIYVLIRGTGGIADQPRAGEVARLWLERLEDLESWFGKEMIEALGGFPGRGDGLAKAEFRTHREEMGRWIARTRERLQNRARAEQ